MFDNLKEDALRTSVIIPLLRELGYQYVFHNHGGACEQGKDVICWKTDQMSGRQNIAVVAKATAISGKATARSGNAGELQMQIRQCFGSPFTDPHDAEQRDVHEVWVISNQRISKEGIEAIKAGVGSEQIKYVRFFNGDELWALVEKHLPFTMWHFAEETRKRMPKENDHYEPQISISGNKITLTLAEKYPGAAEQHPIEFTPKFADAEAAKKFETIVKRYSETGEVYEIPKDLITGVKFSNLFGVIANEEEYTVADIQIHQIEPSPDRAIKLTFNTSEGDTFVCPHVPIKLIRSGTKEALIRSEGNNLLFHIEMLTYFDGREGSTRLYLRDTPYNSAELIDLYQLNELTKKGASIEFQDVSTRSVIGHGHIHGTIIGESTADFLPLMQLLSVIQQKTRIPIPVPDGIISSEEVQAIHEVYEIVTKGLLDGVWHNLTTAFPPSVDLISKLDNTLAASEFLTFVSEQDVAKMILGVFIPLGKMRQTITKAKLINYEEVKNVCLQPPYDVSSVELRFEPDEDSTVVQEYLRWLPKLTA